LTHCHFDHISGVNWLKEKYNVPVIAFHVEEEGIKNKDINLSEYVTGTGVSVTCDKLVFENDEIEVGNYVFKVIHTPGHTSGSTCVYDGENLLSGDTIFADTYGRTDLPTSNQHQMLKSIDKLLNLPPDTKVYPGHGNETTIEEFEKAMM
jgi:glyoxylase-like metal-dependent hydrolase (beta-lactamase superfamily II)